MVLNINNSKKFLFLFSFYVNKCWSLISINYIKLLIQLFKNINDFRRNFVYLHLKFECAKVIYNTITNYSDLSLYCEWVRNNRIREYLVWKPIKVHR